MKKINLLSISVITIMALTSCGGVEKSPIEKAVENLRNGFTLSGEIFQKAKFLDGYDGAYTGEEAEHKFTYSYQMEDGEVTGLSREFLGVEEDGNTYNVLNDTFVRGDDGHVYFKELTVHNTVENIAAVESSGKEVNYDYFFCNPFDYILASDFTLVEGNTYTLARDKASFLSTKLFNAFDICFDEVITHVTCTFENDELKYMELIPEEIMDYTTVGASNKYYILESKVTLNFSNAGSTKLNLVQPRAHKDEHDKLTAAFKNIKDNYTLTINYTATDDGEDLPTNVRKYYFTKDGIFYKTDCTDMENPVANSDVALKVGENGKLTAYGYNEATNKWTPQAAISNGHSAFNSFTRKDIEPVINTVAGEVFDYSANQDKYYVCEELETFIGVEAFIPALETIGDDYLNGFGTGAIVELNEAGNLDTVNIGYSIDNGFLARDVNFELVFENIGTTTLPFGIAF